jgi:hypothetical protein
MMIGVQAGHPMIHVVMCFRQCALLGAPILIDIIRDDPALYIY